MENTIFKREDFEELFKLIPQIETTEKFGTLKGGKLEENNTRTAPYYELEKVVLDFSEIVYKTPVMIKFDWGNWEEGKMILREKIDLEKLDVMTLCKLITAIVRNNRFCDGVLVKAFENGTILKILTAIEKNIPSP